MPSAKMIPLRWPFYSFTLASAFFQVCAVLNAPPTNPFTAPFITACAVLAIVTFLWICTLLCYGRSETEYGHALTRCYTHITSFVVIAVLWFGIGIFFAIHAGIECHRRDARVCQPLWISSLLAFSTFFSSCLCVAIVICPIAVTGVSYNTHVEEAREMAQNNTPDRQQPATEAMSLPNISTPPPAHIY